MRRRRSWRAEKRPRTPSLRAGSRPRRDRPSDGRRAVARRRRRRRAAERARRGGWTRRRGRRRSRALARVAGARRRSAVERAEARRRRSLALRRDHPAGGPVARGGARPARRRRADPGRARDVTREVALAARPEGEPRMSDFEVREAPDVAPADGEVLVRNVFVSVDPYMRGRMTGVHTYVPPYAVGDTIDGGAVGRVVESASEGFADGDWVVSQLGWRERGVVAGERL